MAVPSWHIFLSLDRQVLCTRVKKEHCFIFKENFRFYSKTKIAYFITRMLNEAITFPASFQGSGTSILQSTMLSIVQTLFNPIQLGSSRVCWHLLTTSLNRSRLFLVKPFCCLMKASLGIHGLEKLILALFKAQSCWTFKTIYGWTLEF